MLERVRPLLPAGSPAFLDVPTNPTEEATLAALAIYRAEGCDGVVGFGGGSPIDLSKAVALLASHEGPLSHATLPSMAVLPALARRSRQ